MVNKTDIVPKIVGVGKLLLETNVNCIFHSYVTVPVGQQVGMAVVLHIVNHGHKLTEVWPFITYSFQGQSQDHLHSGQQEDEKRMEEATFMWRNKKS